MNIITLVQVETETRLMNKKNSYKKNFYKEKKVFKDTIKKY